MCSIKSYNVATITFDENEHKWTSGTFAGNYN